MRAVLHRVLVPMALVAIGTVVAPAAAQPSIGWDTLDEVYVNSRTDRVVYPETVRALHGRTVRITGYLLPLDAHTTPRRFLLSALSLAECYFCQPTGPGTTVEVRSSRPIRMQTTRRVRIQGRLVLLARRGRYDDGLVYRLDNARVLR
ncbi:MAG: DUF3299 domain-containing protein [Bacteroidota bacterium]